MVIMKSKEWILAIGLEFFYNKKDILTMYVNTVDFGSYEITGRRGLKKRITQREMLLLRLLSERAGEVVSRPLEKRGLLGHLKK